MDICILALKKLIKSDKVYATLLTAIFLALGVINTVHHEMWRDELQAWLLARDSSSFFDLFKNLKYEGHPGLWHLILFPLAHITKSPLIMQVFHLLIACAGIYLFARFSPFTKFQKSLFAFGYFSFYEYAVICRNYALGMILIFIFCIIFPKRYERFPLLGFILFLAAHTSVHALILVISICIGLFLDFLVTREQPNKVKLVLGFSLIVLGIITSIIQLSPPQDTGWATSWKTDFDINHLKSTLCIIPRAFIPLPIFTFHFWNTNLMDLLSWSANLKLILSCAILLFGILIFIRKPVALLMYLVGTLGLCAFFYTKYFGSMRHHGFLFISFIASVWIFGYCRDGKWLFPFIRKISIISGKGLGTVITIIFLIHFVGGVMAVSLDYRYVFGQGKATAHFIKSNNMDNLPIVGGDTDHVVMAVAGYLESKVYYVRGDRWGTFIIWDKKRTEPISDEDVLKKAKELSLKEKENALIIISHNVMPNLISEYPLEWVATFELVASMV
jgi:hypothetical protein